MVEVCVPGNVLLHVKHGNLYWELISEMPPGAYELCIGETKVNNAVWSDWKVKYNLGFNTDNCKLRTEVIRKHDISQLIQTPSAKNGWETIWSFNDPSTSAHYYSVSFEFCTPKEKPKEKEKVEIKSEPITNTVTPKLEPKKDSVPVKQAKPIELAFYTIYFEKGRSTITQASQTELNTMYSILKTNSTIVEIFGFEKIEGHDATDLKLYNERALVLCGYLMGKGLDQKRIQYIGYGDKESSDAHNKGKKRIELKIAE